MKNILFDFIKKLSSADIDFVICGGVACALQGCERTTLDIDINILMDNSNIEKIIKLIKKEKLVPRIPEPLENLLSYERRKAWIQEKNALEYTVISNDGLLQIDIFLTYPIDYQTLKMNSDVIAIDKYKFRISSKEDLITAKQTVKPAREKDIWDIKMLRELLNDSK